MCKFRRKRLKKKLIKEEYAPKKASNRHVDPKVTASNIWGGVISSLRRRDLTALYTACGDVRDINLDGDELNVFVDDEYLYNIIAGERNIEILQQAVKEVDDVASIKIVYNKKENYVEKDLMTLKRKFGNILQVK
jgi:hypothetical protein